MSGNTGRQYSTITTRRGDKVSKYPIPPCPAPRQTRSDRWKKRPCVERYRAFRDLVKLHRVDIPEYGAVITFAMPMPMSWSKTKCDRMRGQPHRQKPDLDNLLKALLDAVFADDCRVWSYSASKIWSDQGGIRIVAGTDGA